MAKIKIVGEAVVLSSDAKLEDIKLLEKYNPDALKLYKTNEDGKKECVFTVKTATSGEGGINARGAIFTAAAYDGTGMATITAKVPEGVTPENLKEKVAEMVGTGIISLKQVEEKIPDAVAAVKAEKASILENISIG